MVEAYRADLKIIPAQIIEREDVKKAIQIYKEGAEGSFFEGEEKLLFQAVFNFWVTSTNGDGNVNYSWEREGTKRNLSFKRLWRKVPEDRRGVFIKRVRAISRSLISDALERIEDINVNMTQTELDSIPFYENILNNY